MNQSTSETAHSFRERLASVADSLQPAGPTGFHVGRRLRLMERDVCVGRLLAQLRLAFPERGPARGTLVFVWPDTADTHPVASRLNSWVERCGADKVGNLGALAVRCRGVTIEEHLPPVRGTRLEVEFPLSAIPDEMMDLLGLAVRLGIAKQVRVRLQRAMSPESEDRASMAPLDTEANDAAPAKVDGIRGNLMYDPLIHPRVAVNEEVTNSEGVTFRLVVKLVGKRRRRVWIKIPAGRPRVTPPVHAHQRILHFSSRPSRDRRHRRVMARDARADLPDRSASQRANHRGQQARSVAELAST